MAAVAPPAELATIIDKTASFVARNGPEFEQRIKKEQNNVKFSFLQPTDPFHAYYRAKVAELGGGAASTAIVVSDGAAAPAADAAAADATISAGATAKPLAAKPSGITPVEPPKPVYTVSRPIGANPLDLEVIMLTAQYVAANGRSFLTGIASREARNPQFEFLRPTHHLFGYFTGLVDAYSKVLKPPEEALENLRLDGGDRTRTYGRIQQYGAFVRERDRAQLTKDQAADEERRAQMLVRGAREPHRIARPPTPTPTPTHRNTRQP